MSGSGSGLPRWGARPVTSPALPDETVIHGYPGGLVVTTDEAGAIGQLPRRGGCVAEFGWGYTGSGPAELARSLLIAVLGEEALCLRCAGTQAVVYQAGAAQPFRPDDDDPDHATTCPSCTDGIAPIPYQEYKAAVVADWPIGKAWTTTAGAIRQWLADHRGLEEEP